MIYYSNKIIMKGRKLIRRKCFVCGKIVKDNDEVEWHGCDGDKIHASCKPNLDRAYGMINNMSDVEFSKYIRGERELLNY